MVGAAAVRGAAQTNLGRGKVDHQRQAVNLRPGPE
jgi:hypothetical protein